METKEIKIDFFEIGHKFSIPYKKENTSTKVVVRNIIKKYNYPANGTVDVTRNGITIRYRFANNIIISII